MLVLVTISYSVFNTIPEYTFAMSIYGAATYMRYHLFAGRLHLLIIPIHIPTDMVHNGLREANTIIYSVLWENYFILTRFVEILRTVAQWKISGVHCSGISCWRLDDFIYFHIFYLFFKSIITSILGKVIVTKRCVDVWNTVDHRRRVAPDSNQKTPPHVLDRFFLKWVD